MTKGQSESSSFKFDSEHLLQQAIAGLLSRMPNVSGVQILQGSQEYGKDIVFYVPGALSDSLLCACVVKNTNISGRVTSSSGARTVFLQAQQALDTPHVTGTGQEEHVQRVYVVTPFAIEPATIAAIEGALREKKGQVTFIGGPGLFDLFRKHWPDFVADEADAISRYLADTKKDMEHSHPIIGVAAMYQLGSIEKGSTWIHVPQAFERTLVHYAPGNGVEELVTPEDFDQEWAKVDLHRWRLKLQRLDGVLATIAEWGFWTKAKAESFHKRAVGLIEALDSSWLDSIQKQLKITREEVDSRVGTKASIKLADRQELRKEAESLAVAANLALGEGVDKIGTQSSAFAQSSLPAEQLLADSRFSAACALTDLASLLPAGFLEERGRHTWRIESDLLSSGANLLLVGAAGYGKTSFCRWSFLNDAEQVRCNGSKILPVYVHLHKITVRNCQSLDDMISPFWARSGLLSDIADLDATQLRVYLDGLDEVAQEHQREALVRLAKVGADSQKNVQIIITARDYVNGAWLRWLSRLTLRGFDSVQVRSLIQQWFRGRDEESERFTEQLNSTPALAELMQVPLLATLIILVFKQTRRLPESRPRVYEIFIDLMCEGWNLAKGILRPSRFGLRIKKAVLSRTAVSAHRRKSRRFTDDDVRLAIKACVSNAVCADWKELRDELLQDCLISRSESHYEFAHLSFQEFLAAKELLGEPTHAELHRALNDYLRGDDWWLEALRFYIGLSGTPSETYRWITTKAAKAAKAASDEIDTSSDEIDTSDPEERAEELLKSVREIFPEAPMQI